MFLRLMEWVVVILILAIYISQVSIPLWRGTQVFPIFRRERRLREQLEKQRQKDLENKLQKKLKTKGEKKYHEG